MGLEQLTKMLQVLCKRISQLSVTGYPHNSHLQANKYTRQLQHFNNMSTAQGHVPSFQR